MLDLAWVCITALLVLSFWQNVLSVVSELDQHTADFKGGSFPLSIVSSYSSCSKKKDSGAWRKVSTSPRKKSGRFPSPTWNKPDLIEEGKGSKLVTCIDVGTHEVGFECKWAFIFYYYTLN